jgi:hypothetical protein
MIELSCAMNCFKAGNLPFLSHTHTHTHTHTHIYIYIYISVAQQPNSGLSRLIVEVSRSHTIKTHTHRIGLL